jgi:hypothetical protein
MIKRAIALDYQPMPRLMLNIRIIKTVLVIAVNNQSSDLKLTNILVATGRIGVITRIKKPKKITWLGIRKGSPQIIQSKVSNPVGHEASPVNQNKTKPKTIIKPLITTPILRSIDTKNSKRLLLFIKSRFLRRSSSTQVKEAPQ